MRDAIARICRGASAHRDLGGLAHARGALPRRDREAQSAGGRSGVSTRVLGRVHYAEFRRRTEAKLLVITHGGEGAMVVDDRGSSWVPTRRVENPVDICGAGDSFSAGAALALKVTGDPVAAARFRQPGGVHHDHEEGHGHRVAGRDTRRLLELKLLPHAAPSPNRATPAPLAEASAPAPPALAAAHPMALAALLLMAWSSTEVADTDTWWHLKTGQYHSAAAQAAGAGPIRLHHLHRQAGLPDRRSHALLQPDARVAGADRSLSDLRRRRIRRAGAAALPADRGVLRDRGTGGLSSHAEFPPGAGRGAGGRHDRLPVPRRPSVPDHVRVPGHHGGPDGISPLAVGAAAHVPDLGQLPRRLLCRLAGAVRLFRRSALFPRFAASPLPASGRCGWSPPPAFWCRDSIPTGSASFR